jgi:hypothetical protein
VIVSKFANKTSTSLLDEKTIRWKEIRATVANADNATTTHRSRRQALKRACLDPAVCESATKNLLQKTQVSSDQRVCHVVDAVRCQNMNAIAALVHDNFEALRWEDERDRSALLHLACDEHGWNQEVAFVLKETMENTDLEERSHAGTFHFHARGQTARLKLALQAGCDLEEVLNHLKEEFPAKARCICGLKSVLNTAMT